MSKVFMKLLVIIFITIAFISCDKEEKTDPPNTLVFDGKTMTIYSASKIPYIDRSCTSASTAGSFELRAANASKDSLYLFFSNVSNYDSEQIPIAYAFATPLTVCSKYIIATYKNGSGPKTTLHSAVDGVLKLTPSTHSFYGLAGEKDGELIAASSTTRYKIRWNGTY